MWFEDIEIGARREIGSYTFTEAEIIAFAQKYDPQAFHLDPVAAKDSMFGGLVASGWHTAAIWMKLMIDSRDDGAAKTNDASRAGVSPGFENMRWMKPVRPDMSITYTSEVTEKVDLKSRPELGLVKSLNEARDETGDVVMRFTGKGFVPKRPKA